MKKLMAANWKMYKTWAEAASTAADLADRLAQVRPDDRDVLVLPPFTAIKAVSDAFAGRTGFFVGGQDFYAARQGAFTGEISPAQLQDLGCAYALTGHSERRHVLGESDELVGQKTAYGVQEGMTVILCVGETLEERQAGRVEAVLTRQLDRGLAGLKEAIEAQVVVAYEPVWAIGTGEVAGPSDIEAAHGFIRGRLASILGQAGTRTRILYGGSVKPDNAAHILAIDNVDGVLVGGASLEADSFSRIVLA